MAKKWVLILGLMVIVSGGLFAQKGFSMSAGIGGFGDISIGPDIGSISADYDIFCSYINGGGYAFFDLTYAELSFGYSGGIGPIEELTVYNDREQFWYKRTNINFGLLGKYPFWITNNFALFPLLGIKYSVALSLKDEDGQEYDDSNKLNEFWVQTGLGMDISFTEKLYLRFITLLDVRPLTEFEKDLKDISGYADVNYAVGFTAKLAIGYRFKIW